LYRAVDKQGFTVDFYLSRKRDVEAAKQFLRKAMKNQRVPTKITLDGYAASHRAVAELKKDGELPKRVRARTSKYLKRNRTGPPTGKASDWSDGGHEELLRGRRDDKRDRVDGEDQEGAVQDWQTGWQQSHDARDLANCAGCVTRDNYK